MILAALHRTSLLIEGCWKLFTRNEQCPFAWALGSGPWPGRTSFYEIWFNPGLVCSLNSFGDGWEGGREVCRLIASIIHSPCVLLPFLLLKHVLCLFLFCVKLQAWTGWADDVCNHFHVYTVISVPLHVQAPSGICKQKKTQNVGQSTKTQIQNNIGFYRETITRRKRQHYKTKTATMLMWLM